MTSPAPIPLDGPDHGPAGVARPAADGPTSPVYGLDIETDTRVDGLDPTVSSIVAVALATAVGEVVFGGAEEDILAALDEHLAGLEPGVVVTWNGANFDLPFIADRARIRKIALGLRLRMDPKLAVRQPLAGHDGAYRGTWWSHVHLDAYRVYRNDLHRLLDISCSLKSVSRLLGLPTVEVDAARIHELDEDELCAYVASDARLARLAALRRWPTAVPFLDVAQSEDLSA